MNWFQRKPSRPVRMRVVSQPEGEGRRYSVETLGTYGWWRFQTSTTDATVAKEWMENIKAGVAGFQRLEIEGDVWGVPS